MRGSGQTREGIRAVAVRVLRRHAFADAPNTSVVLWFPGEGGQGGEWRAGDGGEMWMRKVRVVERRGESNSGEVGGCPDSGQIVENRKGKKNKNKNQNRNGSNESDDKFAI